jgi:hypothetical protein
MVVATTTLPPTHAPRAQEPPLLHDLIVVQVPAGAGASAPSEATRSTPLDRHVDGTRIVRIDGSGAEPTVLTPNFAGACDPDVSFDGQTIVFSGKRGPNDDWQIWSMRTDGTEQRQLTDGTGHHIAPVFAGARFYLDDPAPTPQIIFAANTADRSTFALYGTDTSGTVVHRLTFNLQSDFSPAVLPTGQIVFTSTQRFDERSDPEGRRALLSVNLDGTDLMPFHGSHESPRYRDMAAVDVAGDRVFFVESDRLTWLGGGDLAFVSWRRPLSSYRPFRHDANGLFHSPTPLPDGTLAASYRERAPGSVFALYRIDPTTGERRERLFGTQDWHTIDAQVLAPRPRIRGRANWLQPGATTGVLYCLDCYRTSLHDGSGLVAPRGTIKHVRIIEGRPRRILGVAPVHDDGSFHVRVPAETPLTFQLLDGDYVAVQTQRTWTWVMGNENSGCIGCHEDRELSPPNRLVTAITKPAVDLVLPPERRRTVDFRNHIAPIIAARCATAGCHVAGGASPVLQDREGATARAAYETLVPRAGDGYVVPGRAQASPLIRLLLDRGADAPATGHTAHGGLARREAILFVEWVDLGAAWETETLAEVSTP